MGEWIAVCTLAAALDLLTDKDREAFGFESVCGLALTLALVRAVLG